MKGAAREPDRTLMAHRESRRRSSSLGAYPRRVSAVPGSKGRKLATLHTVAEAAGVSTATVSKALNGIRVSPENRAKVLAAATALGYVPNGAARMVRGGRTATIGLVIHLDVNPQTELLTILNSQIREFETNGYSVLISVVGGDADVDLLLRRLLERRVDGLVYWNAQGGAALDAYRRAGIPVVAVGNRGDGCAEVPLITAESAAVFDVVYGRLAELGHRRAAEVDPCHAEDLHRAAARRHGVAFADLRVAFDTSGLRRLIESLGSDPTDPTVLFASYAGAVQLLAACEEVGRRVPEDVSIVAVTDSDAAALLRTPLSALHTDYDRFGHAIARALLDAAAGDHVGDRVVPDCISWIDRSSLGPAPRTLNV
jgi:LacI family transcriptional regulator